MIKLTLSKRTSIPYILSLATLLTGSSLVTTNAGDFESWWDGKGLLRGNGDTTQRIGQDSNIIFDSRANLEDQGVKFTGKYKAAFYGVTSSSLGSRGFWCDQLDLGIELNPSRIFNLESLDGVKLFANVRYRDSFEDSRPNLIVESNSMFNPNHMDSGAQWRFNSFGFEYSTKELFPIKDLFTLRGGWLQPSREFLDQPLSKLFLNNAIESAKGLGGNIKWSSSTTTWGGTLNFKPTDWFYVKNGFFLYWPNVSSKNNRALGFRGDDYVTSKNGGMYVAEVGVTPKITADKLEGKYAFGLHVTEVQGAKDANNTLIDSQHGFWIQADQMLWREPSEEAGKLKKEGLSTFNVVSWAEADNRSNIFPLYFHSGLAYTGLLPSRDKDILAIAFAYGYYNTSGSASFTTYRPYTYTSVIEATYQYKINGWSHLQPFVQIIDNPKGNSKISNATIIGFQVGMTF
jgi:porin